MSSLTCYKCQAECVFRARPKDRELFGSNCDSCARSICRDCAAINTTEAHAVSLSQRTLLFYCPECKTRNEDMTDLIRITGLLDGAKMEIAEKDERFEELTYTHKREVESLKEHLNKLSLEGLAKDRHIARLIKRTGDVDEEALIYQNEYETKFKEQKEKLISLNSEIVNLQGKNKKLVSQIEDLNNRSSRMSSELVELNELKNQMLISIETLTKDNEVYILELKRTNYELFLLRDKSVGTQTMAILNNEVETQQCETNENDVNTCSLRLELEAETEKQLHELQQMKELNANMITSIRTLEEENTLCQNEIESLRNQLMQVNKKPSSDNDGVLTCDVTTTTGDVKMDKTRDKTCDWTDKDKEILLLALETYGESIPELQEELPHKTASDIQAVISFYKSASEAERNKELISNWLEILTYLEGKNAGMQLVSRALKYIAMFEKNSGSDVDVNEAMMFLSRVSDNQGAAELSDATGTFLLQVLKALARRLKSQDNTEAEEYFKNLRDIDKSKINDVFMNPLGVPKKMLRLTAADKK